MGEALALVELVQLSDVGRVRHHNEDRALGRGPVIAVADGMGGAKAGEVAAQMAVDAVEALPEPVSAEDVRDAIARANGAIFDLARADSDKAGMGTTLTAALLSGSALSVLHVGDSRAYLWRRGELAQITDDHSVVVELVRRGSLSPAEAEVHPHRNVITRALGAERNVVADIVTQPLEAGDVILLCSDGLSSYVADAAIAAALADATDLNAAARELVALANRAGGADNVTVVLGRVGPPDGSAAQPAAAVTAEHPAPGGAPGQTAEMRVLGGVRGHAGTDRPGQMPSGAPPRVLEPVHKRKGRRGPVIAAAVVVLALAAGAVTWVASRTYVVEPGPAETVRVMHGLPFSIGGLEFAREWQTTGVPVDAVRGGRPDALSRSARGQGEAVELTVDLIWRFGLPEPPEVRAPVAGPAAPTATAPATTAPTATAPGANGTTTTP
ncbi:MAG: Stp1/IreP family PP2C-type Ser/Thr phosphatase [Thermoleophilia bacterium]